MENDFKDKVILITGGSRGIGAACVKAFLKYGATVYFTYKNKKKDNSWLAPATGLRVSLDAEDDIISAVKKILKKEKRIDVLVNNAGIWTDGNADEMSTKVWEETQRINMTSSFIFCREVIPSMKSRREGKIILISSTAGQRGEAFHSHYAASKGAMISFTKSLAAEFGAYNININCVAPGWVYTDMSMSAFTNEESLQNILNGIPLARIATADDIAGPVLFLASRLSRHIQGEIINVNGGSVLCG
jgi:3-oxoacyl-[acyl-carrier protein] reductase